MGLALPFPLEPWSPFADLAHGRVVRVAMSTRQGGLSQPPFDALNVGDHVGDAPEAVAANRRAWAQAAGMRPVWMRQVHACEVLSLNAAMVDAPRPEVPVADAACSAEPGVACAVMVADCLPVLFAHRRQPLVAAAHAGWRGLAGASGRGVLEASIEALADLAGQSPQACAVDLCAWLGPCIGPQAFEVGPEVREAFVSVDADDARWFSAAPRAHHHRADLSGLARARLARAGLGPCGGNDGSVAWCTFSQAEHFFSHRRDASVLGSTGRMVAAIALF